MSKINAKLVGLVAAVTICALTLAACGTSSAETTNQSPATVTVTAAPTSAPDTTTALPTPTTNPAAASTVQSLDVGYQATYVDLNGAIAMVDGSVERMAWIPTSDGKVMIAARLWRDFIGANDPQSWVSYGYWLADDVSGTNAVSLNDAAYLYSPDSIPKAFEKFATYQQESDYQALSAAVMTGPMYR